MGRRSADHSVHGTANREDWKEGEFAEAAVGNGSFMRRECREVRSEVAAPGFEEVRRRQVRQGEGGRRWRIYRYCSMEVEALQAWRAWQERKTEQQSKTA